MHKFARLTQKQDVKVENEALEEPKAKKSRSDNRTSNMDNGTMVEAFKYLNYCQLAKNRLVSIRFRNLIKTHRHKLAILCVDNIHMGRFSGIDRAAIKLFNKEISSEEYNEWVALNNYSKQTSTICQAAGDCQGYKLTAYGDYKDPNRKMTQIFFARVKELNNETWPLFQHFIRLITDPFICIRYLRLIPQADVLKLFASTIYRSNRGRLQCEELCFNFEGNVQESLSYLTDHMQCVKFRIVGSRSSPDHDEQLLDFFTTGSHCTSEIFVRFHHISKAVIVDFVQKFMDLRTRDNVQLVESIQGRVSRLTSEALKSNYAKFFTKEEYEYGLTVRIYEIDNADIGKKIRLSILGSFKVTLMIINL